jgi:predicted ATP-grasp superfamily ATP-dependent carboligase
VRSGDEEKQQFERLANRCDWVLLIAPELNGVLEERALWLDETNARLLSPSGEFLKIASSKSRTAKWLAARGIPVPAQVSPFTQAFAGPLILKRDDGAGGLGMRLVHHRAEISTQEHDSEAYRLERFYPGLAASLAVLCGPSGNLPLQPCEQTLDPNTFEYLGGRTPLPPNLENRAKALALAAVAAMPGTTGYVGVDLILGENPDGSQDVVVEINPRLTTSYVGLRQVCRQNLAQAMLDVAQERPVELSFREERVEFRPDGSSM